MNSNDLLLNKVPIKIVTVLNCQKKKTSPVTTRVVFYCTVLKIYGFSLSLLLVKSLQSCLKSRPTQEFMMAIEQYRAQEYTFSYLYTYNKTKTKFKKKTEVEDKMEFIFTRFYTRKCPLKSLHQKLSLCSLLSSRPILGSFTLSPFLFFVFLSFGQTILSGIKRFTSDFSFAV